MLNIFIGGFYSHNVMVIRKLGVQYEGKFMNLPQRLLSWKNRAPSWNRNVPNEGLSNRKGFDEVFKK
ncbi:hypothetical protein ACFPYN_00215 [Paenisporosarcina macmurdoensis]|uniref:Uncharacterized protein n=1 Tax=Paenisporosarcina macmurdoensis TaxID=212659 RepID=A0ABW1L3U6_9BACL